MLIQLRIPIFFHRDLPDDRRGRGDMRNLVHMLKPNFPSVIYEQRDVFLTIPAIVVLLA